jgi:hypothetical protein
MERDSWGRPNIRAWCGIGLYLKLEAFKKNAQSSVAVVGLGWTSSLNIIPYMFNRV